MNQTDSNNVEQLRSTVLLILGKDSYPTSEKIRETIDQFRTLPVLSVSDDDAEALAKDIEARLDITMTIGSVIQEEFEPWLHTSRKDIDPYYWERYRRLLEEKNFPPNVIAKLDEVTDRILGLLENPQKNGSWDRRGMVVGHVQSGKTANYTGLLTKAADAGYRLIVVIAGIHNNLRSQTQQRIDEGFIGRDSSQLLSNTNRFIGVGNYDRQRLPVTFTSTARDFNKQTAEQLGLGLNELKEPAVLVIKKNPSTLKNIIQWLRAHSARGAAQLVEAPMLLIDDEADNASIDISRNPEEASRINSQIRELLSLFHRSCYVGYTATPFANIFIDPENDHDMIGADLFPRDFIVSLDAPSNYFGGTRIFSEDAEPKIVRHIEDNEDLLPIKHKNGHRLDELPESLKEAIRCFVLARAIRLHRGQTCHHNSMLVNASRFTSVQSELRNMIHSYLGLLKRSVRYGLRNAHDSDISSLRKTYQREYSSTGVSWEEVTDNLHEAIAVIEVVEVNSNSSGRLSYSEHPDVGFNVIAVGGFSLSRGLTLEGLTVSYFLRNSMMYDTLMQMGRWFGYRHGYEDLCRIWMTPDADGWYEHITESIEELRGELREMEKANLTPKDFGLKVRNHPDTLIVTARNKMGTSEKVNVQIGLSNRFIETTSLWSEPDYVANNRRAAAQLIESVREKGESVEYSDEKCWKAESDYCWTRVPVQVVLDFVGVFKNHPFASLTAPKPVHEFIEGRSSGELSRWDVVVVSRRSSSRAAELLFGGDTPVNCQQRTVSYVKGKRLVSFANFRVASRGVEKTGLSGEQVDRAEAEYRESEEYKLKLKQKPDSKPNYPDKYYRSMRTRPLLIIHVLCLKDRDTGSVDDAPVIAWGMSLPKLGDEGATVNYQVNTTWWRQNIEPDIDEEELMENDDG